MSPGQPRSLLDLLQSGDIGRLSAEAASRRELAGRVRAALPPEDAAHVVCAHIDPDGQIVLGMDSAAWASRLRYSTAELLGRAVRVCVAVPGETAG